MIPAKFAYHRASSAADAVTALSGGGEDAKVLAGGQSLIPLLRLRLAAPSLVVDVSGVAEMTGISDEGSSISIGAATTHHAVLGNALVREHAALITAATATVADRQVRHRGTFGGSLAHGDPAGDLPAVALALGATFHIAGPRGRREVAANDFFLDYLTTAVAADEVLVSVSVPKHTGWGVHYEKFNRTAQAWALVGVAAAVRRENGRIAEARVGLTNMGSTPVRAHSVESALAGADASADAVASASAGAADGTHPSSDVTASADYRRHLVTVLTRRALNAALAG